MSKLRTIPKPLVTINQWTIVLSVLTAWITGFEWILLFPLLSGILGLIFEFNPIMKMARLLIKNPSNYIQEDFDQQQFNQKIAVICLSVAYFAYIFQFNLIGTIFSAMVALSAFIAILGFCIGCFIRFQWNQYRYRKKLSKDSF
ncbi:MAG TPA: DUF4395 domain-containing protein [Pseudoneobacillus sp.]|nr:DUF4395 domain-containing protein [Pseudoneobacillus sp.]